VLSCLPPPDLSIADLVTDPVVPGCRRSEASLPLSLQEFSFMSMDPSKWIAFDKLPQAAREHIETIYPYLKVQQCMFQAKDSGVFMKQGNSVKIEKLLDPPRPTPKASSGARAKK
jgi:hypothetical protein